MYQNIFVKRLAKGSEVHLWDDQVGYQKFIYKPYAYLKSASGTYKSLYGDKLKKVNYWEQEDLENGRVFESDVPVETRILVDRYGDSDESSTGHREVFFDIEVEVTDGFPDPSIAKNKITSIALYDKVADSYTCLILGNIKNSIHKKTTIEAFGSEEELLQRFYQKYLEINPTILSGWNIDGFDIPYLYNRTKRVMGESFANTLSPIGEVYYNDSRKMYKIAGVSCLDYLKLYRWFTYTQQSSYRLDFIGQLEVGIGKIEYEGTLQDLYETDINKYVEYNLNDVIIVKALDDKLKFIDLARGVSHLGHVPYEDNFYSSRYLEGAMLVYMKKVGVIAPNKKFGAKMKSDDEKFSGAYVKDPKSGRYDWVYDLDLTSMYPSVIMSLNISPEMKLGKLIGWDAEEFIRGTSKTYSLEKNNRIQGTFDEIQLKKLFSENNITISSNGILYRNDRKGLIPVLLEKWFNERVEYKTLMKKYGNEGDDEKYGYFKRRQHIQKIILNSLYGVLGLPVFRFYDVDNAEATTLTGQELIKFTEKIANHYYNKELDDKEDYCIYTDTDSVFYPALPLVKKRFPDVDVNNEEFMTTQILDVAKEVQDFINNSYNYFAKKFLNIKGDHRFDIKQECVAKSAFWVTKKRYGQWIINDGGVKCDKLDVKGLDIVRSNFPPAMRDLMKNVLQMILSNEPKDDIDDIIMKFKKSMKTEPIEDIALPTGVKGLKKYLDKKRSKFSNTGSIFSNLKKGTPVHVKASIKYNDLLKHFGLNNIEPIRNSSKIKWIYLKNNSYGIEAIAFKGYDDPPEIMDFIKQYANYDKLYKGAMEKKIIMFYNALNWEMPTDRQNSIERFF
tara:strand:+ start:735 stop:3260 length:2526 start_codon:yes stop_codon:yes gene_type:complete